MVKIQISPILYAELLARISADDNDKKFSAAKVLSIVKLFQNEKVEFKNQKNSYGKKELRFLFNGKVMSIEFNPYFLGTASHKYHWVGISIENLNYYPELELELVN